MASLVGGAVGGQVGSLAAGTFGWTEATWSQIGWTSGVIAANYLFAPDGPSVTQEGPRLDDLKVTTSTYGTHLPKVFGAYRIAGNIIWALPLDETRHEETQESGKGGGGSSSTTIWYTYTATWAVSFCEGPITGIRKIWADNKLIYDVGSGASLGSMQSSSSLNNYMTLYLGDDKQEPNWRMQADKPDTPGYRNTCYVLFNDFPLEKHGNKIPDITAEIVRAGDTGPAYYQVSLYGSANNPSIAYNKINGVRWKQYKDYYDDNYFYSNGVNGDTYIASHLVNTCYLNRGQNGDSVYYTGGYSGNNHSTMVFSGVNQENVTMDYTDYNQYVEYNELDELTVIFYLAQMYAVSTSMNGISDDPEVRCVSSYNFKANTYILTNEPGSYYKYAYHWDGPNNWRTVNVPYTIYKTGDDFEYAASNRFDYYNETLYFVYRKSDSLTTQMGIYTPYPMWADLTDPTSTTLEFKGGQDLIVSEASLDTPLLLDASFYNDRIYCLVQDPGLDSNNPLIRVFTINGAYIETITLKDKMDLGSIPNITYYNYSSYSFKIQVDSFGIYVHFFTGLYDIWFNLLSGNPETINSNYIYRRLGTIRTDDTPVNGTGPISNFKTSLNASYYNHGRGSFRSYYLFNEMEIFFDSISSSTISLDNIAREIFLESGLLETDFDVTEGATTEVEGYFIPRGITGRRILEPLLSAYDFALVEYGHKIVLRKQQQLPSVNIPEEDLGANESSRIEYQIAQESDLIRKLTIRYSNNKADYRVGTQSIMRGDCSATEERIVELALALTDNQAKRLVEKNLYKNWLMRQSYSFSLDFDYQDLIAGDVVTVNFDGYTKEIRITKITYTEDNLIRCQGIASDYGIYDSDAEGQDTTINAGVVAEAVGLTTIVLLDSHTLSNQYIDREGEMLGSYGESNSWQGCTTLSKSITEDDFKADISLIGASIFGEVYGVLPDAITYDFDYTSVIQVSSIQPFYSVTEDDLLNGANYAIIGDEILQFANVNDLGNNRYELSTFLRGRRGTESFTSTHVNREKFVLLENQQTFGFITKTLSTTNNFTAVSFGNNISEYGQIIQNTYTGKNLKPYSPEYFKGRRDGYFIDLVWMRRSRYISGYFKTLPLAEDSEEYLIEVYDDLGALVRTIKNITTPNYRYDITTDNFIEDDQVSFIVYQVSLVVGMGYPSDTLTIEGI